jgi:hypothetical protein
MPIQIPRRLGAGVGATPTEGVHWVGSDVMAEVTR